MNGIPTTFKTRVPPNRGISKSRSRSKSKVEPSSQRSFPSQSKEVGSYILSSKNATGEAPIITNIMVRKKNSQ